jgi:hypothetical protein
MVGRDKFNEFSRAGRMVGLVTHVYNPSYSGGGDREDCGSRRAWAKSS